jgi:tagaturonate epimerase
VVARLDPALFREIFAFAVSSYEEDRKGYHVSARVSRVPPADSFKDAQLEKLFDQFDARQVLHVTFGSVLATKDESGASRFRERLLTLLKRNPEIYAAAVEKHLERHIRPFA